MRVRNIECQLAQGQIRRYLNGDALSDKAIEQLEDHLHECEDCSEFFEECKQELIESKNEIEINEEAYAPAISSASSEIPSVPRFLIDAIRQKRDVLDKAVRPVVTHAVIEDVRTVKPSLKSYSKPLAYSIGLAGVLIAMSTIMRDPSRVFGDRVESAYPAENSKVASNEKPAASTVSNPANTSSQGAVPNSPTGASTTNSTGATVTSSAPPITGQTNPNSTAATTTAQNSAAIQPTEKTNTTPTSKPSTVRQSTARSKPRTTTAQRPRPATRKATAPKPATTKAPNPGIRIYDGNGNPISQ